MFQGERLKNQRIKNNLTQATLGEMIGVTKSAICFYEKGKRSPSLENIIDFVHIFGVDANYFLGIDLLFEITDDGKPTGEISTMTKEEVMFIEELKKNKLVYNMLFENPKRGADLIKNKIG